jgi:NitT/TauT family transport system substrate-binding protein
VSDLRTGTRFRRLWALVGVGALAVSLAACGSDNNSDGGSGGGSGSTTTVRLGYFPNLTHASAIVGLDQGYFADALSADNAKLEPLDFNSGSDTIDALLSGDLDATYIGPSPAITAYATSQNVSVISGATSGGASLVVSSDITTPADLKGKTIATPGQGNTQDVAFKYWLKQQGFNETSDGQGDVTVLPQDNSDTVEQFQQGDIDGGWLPEPYASILVSQGGTRLVNEASLWPKGKFVTTQLLVNNDFLKDHANLVDDLLKGQIQANDYIAKNSDAAKQLVAVRIQKITGGSAIPADALDEAWKQLTFTNDPIADSLLESAQHAEDVKLIDPISDLSNIYDLDPLNKQLTAANEPTVSGPTSP